ncbi:AMP-binding protein [Sphingomicrobium sp. XHP0239]|uniref:AMP-binding protein n=1 Tax=Sphingomicrobium maritimum TaxID=3133972 RepID=UPI0031CC8D8E
MDVAPLDHLTTFGKPDAPALTVGGVTLDYAALETTVGRIARWLLEQGFASGERVATWDGKGLTTCLMPLAAARAGLVHVPINPALKAAQIQQIIDDCDATVISTRAPVDDARWLTLDPATLDGEPMPPSDHAIDALAALLYTSGSTGNPKGVMLTHANLMLGAEAVADYTAITPETRTLAVLPLAFDYGQNQLLATWRGGGHVTAIDYLLPNDVRKAVSRHAITYLAALPPLWHQLMRLDWSAGEGKSVTTITNTGGAMTGPLLAQLRDAFPNADAHLMYGLTEAFRAASLPPQLADTHPTSVGTAIPHCELMVVREDGAACDPGEEGELVQAGPLVAKGYWNAPDKTAEKFRPAPRHSRFGGIAVWSGDRFVRDGDGLLHFRARADRMIKISGNRVSPDEIVQVAMKAEGIEEAAVTTIPDESLGAAIVLHVVGTNDEEAIRRAFRAAPSWFAPQRIVRHDQLPRNPNGKIDHQALERLAR